MAYSIIRINDSGNAYIKDGDDDYITYDEAKKSADSIDVSLNPLVVPAASVERAIQLSNEYYFKKN